MSDTNNRPRLIEHIHYHHRARRSSAPSGTASGAPTGNGPALAFLAIVLLIVLLVAYLGLRALSSFWNRDHPVEARLDSSPPSNEQGDAQRGDTATEYRVQLANWKERRARAQHTLARLVSERERLLDRLLSLGVRSSDDLKNNAVALPLADELAELTGQIKMAQTILELKEGLRGPEARPGILSDFERDAALNEALRRRSGSQTKE